MLSERSLITLGLLVSLAGIIALYLLLLSSSLPLQDLSVVDEAHVGSAVRVAGVVTSVRRVKNVTILTIAAPVERAAVIFDLVNISEQDHVDVEGRVQDYQGAPELVVDRLEVTG